MNGVNYEQVKQAVRSKLDIATAKPEDVLAAMMSNVRELLPNASVTELMGVSGSILLIMSKDKELFL